MSLKDASPEESSEPQAVLFKTDAEPSRVGTGKPGELDDLSIGYNSAKSLKKPVQAIGFTPKKGNVNRLTHHFLNVLVSHAQANAPNSSGYYVMTLGKFTQDARYTSRNLEYLTEVLESMAGTTVTWGDTPKNLKGRSFSWETTTLLGYAKVWREDGGPTYLSYRFQPEIHDQILHPEGSGYARVPLDVSAALKTTAGHVLCEIGYRYLTFAQGLTVKRPWREWVPILTGKPGKYEDLEYKYFARDVLKKALREANQVQDVFQIVDIPGKVRRKTETLQFRVTRKAPASKADAPSRLQVGVEDLSLIGRAINLKIAQGKAEELLLEHGAPKMRAALGVLEQRLERKADVRNAYRYLRTLLASPDLQPVDREAQDVEATEVTGEPKPDVWATLVAKYRDAWRQEQLEALYTAEPADREAQLAAFEQEKLPRLPQSVRESWAQWRQQPGRPLGKFLAVYFLDWKTENQFTVNSEEVVHWAAKNHLLVPVSGVSV